MYCTWFAKHFGQPSFDFAEMSNKVCIDKNRI